MKCEYRITNKMGIYACSFHVRWHHLAFCAIVVRKMTIIYHLESPCVWVGTDLLVWTHRSSPVCWALWLREGGSRWIGRCGGSERNELVWYESMDAVDGRSMSKTISHGLVFSVLQRRLWFPSYNQSMFLPHAESINDQSGAVKCEAKKTIVEMWRVVRSSECFRMLL